MLRAEGLAGVFWKERHIMEPGSIKAERIKAESIQ